MKEPLVIIILGPPGSGKGTQAKLLQEKFCLKYIGSGDLLRARKKRRDFTGKKLKKILDIGEIAPTFLISDIWTDKLEEFKKVSKLKGIIFDGSPRRVLEAIYLDEALDWYEWNRNKKVIYIKISPKESIWRLTKRRMCEQCGRLIPYVGQFRKLKKCDKCAGELVARADDTIKGVKERLGWFRTEVLPTVNYYRKHGQLIEINGEQSIEDVLKDILKAIKQK